MMQLSSKSGWLSKFFQKDSSYVLPENCNSKLLAAKGQERADGVGKRGGSRICSDLS